MPTECIQTELDLGRSGARKLVGAFDGGAITSNGGVGLLAGADRKLRLAERLAGCFTDHRVADAIKHTLPDLLRQRIFGLALGYEDLIDHDALRFDPALAAVIDKPGGTLAGKSTLNRLEHASKIGRDRHHKLDHDGQAIERLFVDLFLEAHREPPMRIVIDLDATDDPLYGEQEGRHFHGYYDCYCYLPLYVFCGRHLLAAKLRSSANDAADGATQEAARIVGQIRECWPKTTIVIRADSGFCRDDLMSWCEEHGVQYVLGLAGNERLTARIAPEMKLATRKAKRTGKPARVFGDFRYRTRKSWSAERRVIGKAEFTNGGANPRFIVTNVHAAFGSPRFLYETVYCQRGEMENRLKECQGDLFADRTPTPTMRANQLRLWLSSLAYVLMCAVRRIGLAGTELERATCGTIRLVLLKLGARVTVSVRRVKLAFASSFPKADVFARAARRLCT
ncbi:MAG: IS1380 family transposase [Methyloceanibacter sp.]|uniref:IS1380 family transposase n=1 Tax=Methyloceanibacter sp. TaxID=1965321 RepID=UPI003C617323